MGMVTTYDADQYVWDFGGINIDSGWGEDTYITVDNDADAFTYIVGTDGSVNRSKTLNKVKKVSFFLQKSSKFNDLLSALHIVDVAAPNGAGIVPAALKDLNGTTTLIAQHGWIAAFPKVENARAQKDNEWMFVLADADMFVGSNPNV
jgi:hypothetical protein